LLPAVTGQDMLIMHKINKNLEKTNLILAVFVCLLLIFCGGCERREKVFTVGIAVHVPLHLEIVDGFKAGMRELGYTEGKNIRYLYDEPLGVNQEVIDAELKKLISHDVDLLLTTSNDVSLRAKKAVEGTDIPVVATSVFKPVEIGLVENFSRPGGNVTCVWLADTMPKMLEYLMQIVPGINKIYLPYNPDDQISVVFLRWLDETASQLGIRLVLQEVSSVEEAVEEVKVLSEDIGAIYRIPSPTLDARNNELSQAAIDRRIPMVSMLPLDESILISMVVDYFETGKLAARIAHEIRLGAKPAEMPLVSTDTILTVNLKTAEKIGLKIPDGILIQANKIIR
jgi:putative ABC transport system substrate-binding protein